MTRLHVIVEGQTEEGFVKGLLAPHLQRHSVYANVILVPNRPGARQRKHRGGLGSFGALRKIIERKLYGDTTAYTTTMFDYYGLPKDFPGLSSDDLPYSTRVNRIEQELALTFDESPRFIPYLQVHEFEALLFSDVEALHNTISALAGGSPLQLEELNRLVA